MKILFLTDNFPPEVNAPATRTYEHCREWVRQGAEVTVITCFPNFPEGKLYEGYKNKLFKKESIDGIRVIRVWSYITANEGFFRRTIDYFSYGFMAFIFGLFVKTDIIVATSPQFFTVVSGRWLSLWKRKPWIMEVRDLWPVFIKSIYSNKPRILISYLEWWERRLYISANKIVVVTDAFKDYIVSRGIVPDKIFVVKNGANKELFTPRPKSKQLLDQYGLNNKFIVGYIGTHGMAHKLDFILECAASLEKDFPQYHFLFIGAGAEKRNLMQLANDLNINNLTMLDPVPKHQVADYLALVDLSLIPLRKIPVFRTVIPSKIFESSAMQVPILLGVDGESKALIEKYRAGLCFEPENATDFYEKLHTLYKDRALYSSCQNGCLALAEDFDRKNLALEMLEVIKNTS